MKTKKIVKRCLPGMKLSLPGMKLSLPGMKLSLPGMKLSLPGMILFLFLFPGPAKALADGQIPVVPYPQEVVPGKGSFSPSGESFSIRMSGMEGRTGKIVREQLTEAFSRKYGKKLSPAEGGRATLWIGLPGTDEEFRELAEKNRILPGEELGEEGYLLRIGRKNIYITANSQAGAFYGVQTLKQLLRGYAEGEELPAMTIRDWPAIAFRCIMDDISRGPIPTPGYLRHQVQRYAEIKINRMSFYIEHVLETEHYPDMAPAEGGISVQEFMELSEYAADYHIELVGNFQSLGHSEKILSLPQFRYLGATERMLDPLNPEVIEFLGNVYGEMAPAFTSPVFTPNLDEAWDLSRGELRGAAAELGPARIYADHVKRVDSLLSALGKRTLVWEDIALEHPEILDLIPKHIIMGAWNYSPADSYASFIDPLKEAGFDFIVTPGILNSRRLIPDFRMSTINIRNFINDGYDRGTLGVYCTVWDDGGLHFFSHDWYGVAYTAEQCWRPNRDPLGEFDLRFSRAVYADPSNTVPRTLHSLNRLTDLAPTFEMNSNVFQKALVPERGSKVSFNPDEWTQVRQIALESDGILEGWEGSASGYERDLDFLRFTIAQYAFLADSREQLIGAAEAYNRACELQRDDRSAALGELERSHELVKGLKDRMDLLAWTFLVLWDRESRAYWRDRAEQEFSRHQIALADQDRLLGEAIGAFEAGAWLPPPTEVRMDIRSQGGQYFPYWLLTGSFHIDAFDEYPPDFLGPTGGEAAARPFPGMSFTDTTGVERMWIKYDSPKQDEIDFTTIFEPKITAVAYAYCTIDAPEDMTVSGLLGSNDGATVWLNGQEVYHFHGKRSLIPDEDEIPLDLLEGRNHLLIKVEQWKADWGFSFRLKDVEIRYHKQKYYIR